MYQQVNLFQPVFRREEKVFSALTLAQLLGLVVLIQLSAFGVLRWQLFKVDQSVNQLTSQYDSLNTNLEKLEAANSGEAVAGLDKQIAALKQQVSGFQALIGQLDQFTLPDQHGFSAYMKALAKTRVAGLWLTRIELHSDGSLTLEGRAWDPKLIPEYLARLPRQAAFSGADLAQVEMERVADNPRQVKFVLSNQHKGIAQP